MYEFLKNNIMKLTAGATALHALILQYGDRLTQSVDVAEMSSGDITAALNAAAVLLAGVWSVKVNAK